MRYVRDVAALPDPVGRVIDDRRLHNGLELSKVRVPIGRILVVYEARPNDCRGYVCWNQEDETVYDYAVFLQDPVATLRDREKNTKK